MKEQKEKNMETRKSNNETTTPMKIYGVREIGIPVIVAEFKGNNLLFILDTGSDTNFLDKSVYEHFKDDIETTDGDGFVIGVEGTEIPRGKLLTMPMKIGNKELSEKFFTLPEGTTGFELIEKQCGARIHGILGTPFILHNKLVIDLTNGEMFFGVEKQTA